MNTPEDTGGRGAERWLAGSVRMQLKPLSLAAAAAVLAAFLAVAQARLLATVCHRAIVDNSPFPALKPLIFSLLFIVLLRSLLVYGGERTAASAVALLKQTLRSSLYRRVHLLRARSEGGSTAHLVEAVTQGVDALETYVTRFLPQLALAAIFPLLCVLLLFAVDWRSSLVLLLSAPFIPLFMILIGKGAESLNRRQWSRLASLSGHLLDLLRGLPDLKICGAVKREAAAVAEVSEEYRQATMTVLRVAFLSAFTLEFFTTIGTAVVAVIVGFRLLSGSLQLVDGLFLLLVAPEFYLPFRSLGLSYHARMQGIAAAEKLAPLLADVGGEASVSGEPAAVPEGLLTIAFEAVTFRHEGNRGGVNDIVMTLPAGTATALVGASGAGKSTLSGLLLGFARPESGMITVNGIDLGRLPLREWHRRLAWIPQQPFFICGSIRENLLLGLPPCSDAVILAALDAAAALTFVTRLPGGLAYQLGENGAGLSGGELRRLAIARVLLRNPSLVVLDEPTAGLDRENERLVVAAVRKLAVGRTLLLISHREETVAWIDRRVVMVDGRIDPLSSVGINDTPEPSP